ncbi:MAG: hypothetical protein GY801_06520 [bacterium]|nr:hypothetical protein [bacterium]
MAEETKSTSSGVKDLIGRLKDEGVQAGRQEAENIVREAQERASRIVADAKAESEKLLKQAHTKNEADKVHANESLRVAVRDTEIELRDGLKKAFESHVKRLVSKEVQDKEFLRQLLLAIVGTTAQKISKDQKVDALIPEYVLNTSEEGAAVSDKGNERLKNFVRSGTGEMLRAGVELKAASDFKGGIKVKLVGEDVVFDFSADALSNLILKHLLPRYRAIVEGVE